MNEAREKLIKAINELPEDKLKDVEELIKRITNQDTLSIENIYKKAVEKYNETLQKLAQ